MNSEHNAQRPSSSSGEGQGEGNSVDQNGATTGKRKRALIVFAILLGIAAIGGLLYWLHARQFEDTDDAQIDGDMSPVGTRIDGTILRVYVDNNQFVHAGDPLVDLDPRDNQVKFEQAEAQFLQAQGQLSGTEPNVPITEVQNSTNILSAKADVASAVASLAGAERDRDQSEAQVLRQEAANNKAQNDVNRYRILATKLEISKSDFDQYDSTAKQQVAALKAAQSSLAAAERTVDQRKAQLEQARSRLLQNEKTASPQLQVRRADVRQQEANLKSSSAQLEQSRLNLTYTKIVAPVSGVVMKRSAQIGARVSTGQQLLTISQIDHLWVTANFKETQLRHMRPGQHATIHVDAFDSDYSGTVESIGGATGSVASVLPPENATGNFVKVVQRIPVRIKLEANQQGIERLRPGMSVEPKVHLE